MRIVTIIGLLIVGIVGLLMSICGGFFFFAGAWQSFEALVHNGPTGIELGPWPLIVIGGPCLIAGGVIAWLAWRAVGRRMSGSDPDKTE